MIRIYSLLIILAALSLVHCNEEDEPSLSLAGTSWGTYVTIEVGTETHDIAQTLVNPYTTKFNEDGTLDYSERGVWNKAQWIWEEGGRKLEIRYPSGDVRTLNVTLISPSEFKYIEYEIDPKTALSQEQADLFAFANRLLILSGKPTTSDKLKIIFRLKK